MIDEILKNRHQSQAHLDSLNQVRFMLKNGTISSEELAVMALENMNAKPEWISELRQLAEEKRKNFLEVICGYRNVNFR